MIDHYDPQIMGAQDYYPFGMLSRVAVPNDDPYYRFGFNGKMDDNDVKGLGNEQDYGMRIYDPRVGKFLSIDPLQAKYPWYTPYQFAGNTPIQAIDVDGLEPSYIFQSKGQLWQSENGDNLPTKNLPTGHEQFLRNSFSLNSTKVENEEFSHSLNWVPFLGEWKGFAEATRGKEFYTDRKLSADERMMALLPIRKGGAVRGEIKSLAREEIAVAKAEEKVAAAHGGVPAATESNAAGNKVNRSAVTGGTQTLGKEASSEVLGKNIEATGVKRPENTAAHHIVAGSDARADEARQILQRENIDINDAANGVFLPKSSRYANPPASTHSKIHTDKYYEEITRRLSGTPSGKVKQELKKIGAELSKGTFPYN